MPAQAIPERFTRSWFDRGGSRTAAAAEYEVYAAICDGLDEAWTVAPATELHVARYQGHVDETELDLVLFHELHGVVLLEVKSWEQVQLRAGRFVLEGEHAATKDPVKQLKRHRNLLGEAIDATLGADRNSGRLSIAFGLALPRLEAAFEARLLEAKLPQGWVPGQLLGPSSLGVDVVQASMEALALTSPRYLDAAQVRAVMAELFPDQRFDYSAQGVIHMRRRREVAAVRSELEVVETLDQNRRSLVTGPAGSGKSLLAIRWAERALARGEQVLVTCKGRPNAALLKAQLGERPGLTVRPFLDLLAERDELPPNPFGRSEAEAEDRDGYWKAAERIFSEHHGRLQLRYDTVVVDEIQDLDAWARPVLEHLVGAGDRGRVLAVGDLRQALSHQPSNLEATYEGWARASLPRNHRSPVEVQGLLELATLGPLTAQDLLDADPTGEVVTYYASPSPVDDPGAWWAVVEGAIQRQYRYYVEELDVPNDQIAILTTSKNDQRDLVASFQSTGWEDHVPGTEIIETVNMMKGAEFQAVILVPNPANPSPLRPQLISGMSRASAFLTIVGPDPILGGLEGEAR